MVGGLTRQKVGARAGVYVTFFGCVLAELAVVAPRARSSASNTPLIRAGVFFAYNVNPNVQ